MYFQGSSENKRREFLVMIVGDIICDIRCESNSCICIWQSAELNVIGLFTAFFHVFLRDTVRDNVAALWNHKKKIADSFFWNIHLRL